VLAYEKVLEDRRESKTLLARIRKGKKEIQEMIDFSIKKEA